MNRKICNLKKGVIQVYQFEPFNYRLNLFRLEEMKRIPREEQILRREPTRSWFTPRKGVFYECDNYILRKFDFSKFEDIDTFKKHYQLYVYGLYHNDPVKKYPGFITLSPKKDMTDIRVQLTEDAYLAYLLENEQFDHEDLVGKRLEKQKTLFHLSEEPLMEFHVDEMKNMFDSCVVSGSYDETMKSLERSSHVYQKIH